MSSDEDFSLIMESQQPYEETLEGIESLITNYKLKCNQLVQQQNELSAMINDSQDMTQKCKARISKLAQNLQEDQQAYQKQMDSEMAKISLLSQEEFSLLKEIQEVEAALKQEDVCNEHLRQQTNVFNTVPEKKVVFLGETQEKDDVQRFEMTSRITYPMEEGTALITFKEEEVAKRILSMKKHHLKLDDECRITVMVQPVQLMLPSLVELTSEVCPRRIAISNLPKMDTETLLNKLEIHFHRSKHGGGEVAHTEFLPDSGTVALTFMEENIAQALIEKEFHQVELQKKVHTVRVTPFVKGTITKLQTKMLACPRTVLLTGIPPVEHENLQDLVEIHFMRSSNGGGDVEAFLYNPLGQHVTALFENIPPKN